MKIDIDDNSLHWLLDLLMVLLIAFTSLIAYGLPFWNYPYEPSNPWPYAYTVIQDQIIKSGNFLIKTPQFGALHRSDHTWFLIHHLVFVDFKLLTDLPYETIERSLSVVLSIVFFLGFYVFAKQAFGPKVGFISSMFFLFIPRTHNYLVTVNGEFFSWLILFPALTLFLRARKNHDRKELAISALLGACLPLANLSVFVLYILITWLYLLAEFVSTRNLIRTVKTAILIILPILVISLPPLIATHDISPGSSSTIGSLFEPRHADEAYFEKVYYDSYCNYWMVFANEQPLLVGFKYISDDYLFISFVIIFYLNPAILGIIVSLRNYRNPILLLPSLLLFSLLALTAILFSPIFGLTIMAFGIRLLLYFGWALALLCGLGVSEISKIIKKGYEKGATFHITRKIHLVPSLLVASWLLGLIFSGITISAQSAGYANSHPTLYAKEFKDALEWIKMNTPTDAVIISNDWTEGIFWLKSQRLSLTEGPKGSAVYLTYKEIVTKLNDAREILTTSNVSKTILLMNKYNSRYIVIWTRTSGYYVCPPEKANIAKFEMFSKFRKVFDEESVYHFRDSELSQEFASYAKIYYLVDNSTSSVEMLGPGGGARAGYTNGTYILTYKIIDLKPSFSLSKCTEAKLHVYMKRIGNPVAEGYNIKINDQNIALNVTDIREDWESKSFQIPTSWLSSSINVTFPKASVWDPDNQILIGTTEVPGIELTYYSFDGTNWVKWIGVNLYVFLELTYED